MVDELTAQGWVLHSVGAFSDEIGAFWMRREAEGPAFGFVAEPRHANRAGIVHGGVLATIADNLMGWTLMDSNSALPAATIQLNLHFVSAARPGDFIEGRAEIVRATRSVNFMRGKLTVRGGVIATSEGIWKLSGPKKN